MATRVSSDFFKTSRNERIGLSLPRSGSSIPIQWQWPEPHEPADWTNAAQSLSKCCAAIIRQKSQQAVMRIRTGSSLSQFAGADHDATRDTFLRMRSPLHSFM